MPADFLPIAAALKGVFAGVAEKLTVTLDTPAGYTVVTQSPSPFPQHKGQPMFFGSVKIGKAYVSLHIMPLYMCPELQAKISPALKKRMQGKTCFNFTSDPPPELLQELGMLAEAGLKQWAAREWV